MSQEREDKFIAAALTGMMASSYVVLGHRGPRLEEIADQAIYIGKFVAKRTEPFQPKETKKEFQI